MEEKSYHEKSLKDQFRNQRFPVINVYSLQQREGSVRRHGISIIMFTCSWHTFVTPPDIHEKKTTFFNLFIHSHFWRQVFWCISLPVDNLLYNLLLLYEWLFVGFLEVLIFLSFCEETVGGMWCLLVFGSKISHLFLTWINFDMHEFWLKQSNFKHCGMEWDLTNDPSLVGR